MPTSLDWLLQRLTRLVTAATDALEQSYPDGVQAWEQEIARQLARYHAAAIMAGANVSALSPAMTTAIKRDLATQLRFLEKFGVVVQSGKRWENGWASRAEMYAGSIATPYWRGATKMLPLPAMPCDGTSQCLTRCKCSWDVNQLDGDGNYDAQWRLSAAESCQTCLQRSRDWGIKIRDGVLQLG